MMIFVILVSGFLVRIAGVARPLLGNFSTKGIVYAMIARNFSVDPGTIIYPTLNVLVGGKKALHMTEWPIPSYLAGAIYKYLHFPSIDVLGRGISVLLFMLSACALYSLVKKLADRDIAVYSLIFYTFFPLGIIYGQSFQMAAAMMFTITVSFLILYEWMEGKRTFLRAVSIWGLVSMLLLMKIQMLCLALPAGAMLFSDKRGRELFKRPRVWLFAVSCLFPALLWYVHTISVAKTYDNVYFSILYSMKTRVFPDPRIFTFGFYSQVFKTLIRETLTPAGAILAAAGLIFLSKAARSVKYLVIAYIAAMAIYFFALPRKIYEMNYYFMPLLMPGAILAAIGLSRVTTVFLRRVLVLLFIVLAVGIAYNPAFKTPENETMIVDAAEEALKYIPKGARVIVTSRGPDIALLYYSGRDGWTLSLEDSGLTPSEISARAEMGLEVEQDPVRLLDNCIGEGASFYICDDVGYLKKKNDLFYRELKDNYRIVYESDAIIVDLSERFIDRK